MNHSITRPGGTVAELWDGTAGTYTKYDASGAVVQTRPLTAAEAGPLNDAAALDAQQSTAATLRDALTQAMATNRAFVALTPPTNAQIVAQAKAAAVQNNRIIRLLVSLLDGTD